MNDATIARITEIAAANKGTLRRRQTGRGENRTDSFFVYFDGFKKAETSTSMWDAIETIRAEFSEPRDFKLFMAKNNTGHTLWNLVDGSGYTGEQRRGFEVRAR